MSETPQRDERRIRAMAVQPALLFWLIRHPEDRTRVTSAGMPADARFLSAAYDDLYRVFRVYVESATFDPVPEGQRPPDMWVEFTRHEDGAR